jgi:hypothetical protein
MEPADFAVRIEEVMLEACTAYECIFEDDDEIARIWKFLIDDALDGYIAVEDNDGTLDFMTVSIGLYLKDISDYLREDLIHILYANSELINANLSVVKVPVAVQAEDEEADPDEEAATEPPVMEEREILIISTRLPFDAFEPDDFRGYIDNMLFQYYILIEPELENEDLDDLDDLEEIDDELGNMVKEALLEGDED